MPPSSALVAWVFGQSRTALRGSGTSRSKRSIDTRLGRNRRKFDMKKTFTLAAILAAMGLPALAQAAAIDWAKVDAAIGKSAVVSGDVHRYGLPRSDHGNGDEGHGPARRRKRD